MSIIEYRGIDTLLPENRLPIEERGIVGDAEGVARLELLSARPIALVPKGGGKPDLPLHRCYTGQQCGGDETKRGHDVSPFQKGNAGNRT